MKKFIFWAAVVLAGAGIWSCERNDDEPTYPPTPISRLYVSFSDIQNEPANALYRSLVVFAKADSAGFKAPDTMSFPSNIQGGSGVFFDPNLGRVFQGNQGIVTGVNRIELYSVSRIGSLGAGPNFADTLLYMSRDLLYDHPSQNLYVSALRQSGQLSLGYLHVYNRPNNINGTRRQDAHTRYQLPSQPWGLAYRSTGDQLMMAMTTGGQVWRLDSISRKAGNIINPAAMIDEPDAMLKIDGATRLRGICYSEKLNLLAATDLSSKIYIFENARAAFTGEAVKPTRTLTGIPTEISEPMDVAIDDREGKNFLYVVDQATKKVLRYPLSASGNEQAEASYTFPADERPNMPISIHLDAREGASSN